MRKTLIATTFLGLAAAVLAAGSVASAQDSGTVYHFGTHEKHTNITFVSEADIENIYGKTHTMSGTFFVNFDELKGKCNLRIPVDKLETGIEKRDEHLRSDSWLDAEAHPVIQLVSDDITLAVKDAKKGLYTAKVEGTLDIHGVKHARTFEATVHKLPSKLGERIGQGEWVRVKSKFDVAFSDHDIVIPNKEQVGPKVSETWSVGFDCFATTEAPERR